MSCPSLLGKHLALYVGGSLFSTHVACMRPCRLFNSHCDIITAWPPFVRMHRSKIGFKDTAAFKATAKKLAPVKAAVMRLAADTVTAITSVLHVAGSFVGGSAAHVTTAVKARASAIMRPRGSTMLAQRPSMIV